MRATTREFSSNLLILLSLIFLSVPSLAYPYEKIIDFDSGVPSGVAVSGGCTYVPTTLPSGTGNALRCTQSGDRPMYVGFGINPLTPLTNNIYVRFYVRWMPGWTFGSGSSQLKLIIWNTTHRNFTTIETHAGSPRLEWEDDACVQYGGTAGRCISTSAGTVAADGVWRLVEARSYKNGANGRFQIWLDGVSVMDYAVDIGADNFTFLEVGYQNTPSGGYLASRAIEYEDLVIADHYVGPNGATFPPPPPAPPAPPPSPVPPVNLRVQ